MSVFTHMRRREVANYLSEISRVLKPNGKCYITYFLINEETLGCLDKLGDSADGWVNYKFQFEVDGGLTSDNTTCVLRRRARPQ